MGRSCELSSSNPMSQSPGPLVPQLAKTQASSCGIDESLNTPTLHPPAGHLPHITIPATLPSPTCRVGPAVCTCHLGHSSPCCCCSSSSPLVLPPQRGLQLDVHLPVAVQPYGGGVQQGAGAGRSLTPRQGREGLPHCCCCWCSCCCVTARHRVRPLRVAVTSHSGAGGWGAGG